MTCQVSYTQFTGDDLFDIIEKFSNWIQWEPASLIHDLPHLGAAYELWELITVAYDVNTTTSAIELIEAGELTVSEWNEFVIKYSLREKGWKLYKQIVEDGENKIVTV